MAVNETTQLGCGRRIEDVWDHVDSPPDRHELTCADCQDARGSLGTLASATRELTAADAADPTLQTSPEVLDSIVAIARAEVRRGRRIPLHQPRPDHPVQHLLVSEQTIAGVVRHVSDLIPGLETRRCRVELAPPDEVAPGSTGSSEPARVRVDLRVSVSADLSIPETIATLRADTIAALRREIGIGVARIDVDVEDIHDGV